MARWEPNARGRLIGAAMDLFAERGYDETTACDIASAAGVTERTFFRHFADKREVLFDPTQRLMRVMVATIADAPADVEPLDVVLAGLIQVGKEAFDGHREFAVQRNGIIESTPALRERELLKMASLIEAAAEALQARGVESMAAKLAAHSAITVFQVAFQEWVTSDRGTFESYVNRVAEALRQGAS